MAYAKKSTKKTETKDKEHGDLVTWVNEAEDATTKSRALSEKARDYYDSKQWTAAEELKLKAQKQAATVINRCKPKVDALMGMERANRTTAKAKPRTPKETAGATAVTEAVRFVLQDNMFERHRSDAWENMLIEGTGGIEICVKPKEKGYKIILRSIPWDRLIYDPHSRSKSFTDNPRYQGQYRWMDYEDAIDEFPDVENILKDQMHGSETYEDKPRWMDDARERCKIVELYYRKGGDWWYCCFTRGGPLKGPMKSPYINEEGETENPYEFASLFVDRDGSRYGSLLQVLDVQDEINKRRSKALHLMSVRQTFGTKGAVEDLNKARAELATPDGHVEFAYGELNKDFGVLPTGDMAQAQFNLLTEAKMEMDLVGANSATQGKDQTVQSGVALRQRALTGQTELAPMFDMLKNLDIRVYRKTWNRIKQYWKEEMWLRVTDDENNLKFVGLNKPITRGEEMLKQAQSQGAPPEILQQLQQQISQDPMMTEIVSTENDIVNLDVDIVMDDAPDTVTQEVEDFQAMAEMVKSGFPIPPEAVIMASPLSNKDKIIKMMKERPQIPPELQKQMEQMQEQLQSAGEEVQKLNQENQVLKQDNAAEMAKVNVDRETEMGKAAIKKQQLEDEFNLKQEAQRREAELAHAKAMDEFNLKKEMMEKEHALAREMAEQDHALEKDKMEFDKQIRAEDRTAKAAERQAEIDNDEEDEMDRIALKALTDALDMQQKTLDEMLKTLKNPPARNVSIANIEQQRNASGELTGIGATVKPTLQ